MEAMLMPSIRSTRTQAATTTSLGLQGKCALQTWSQLLLLPYSDQNLQKFGIHIFLVFFWKVAKVSDDFKVMGSSSQTLGAATEKRLPKLSLAFGKITCCEIDDLWRLGIFERCRRLAKYIFSFNHATLTI